MAPLASAERMSWLQVALFTWDLVLPRVHEKGVREGITVKPYLFSKLDNLDCQRGPGQRLCMSMVPDSLILT